MRPGRNVLPVRIEAAGLAVVLVCAKIRQRHQPGGFARGMGARVVRILLRGRGLLHPLRYRLRELAIVRGDGLAAIVPRL